MNNNYAGATTRIGGATYLDTRAILHVEEGFQGVKSDGSGVSTEYINVGDFEISDFNHGGAFRQSLQLNAHSLSKRPNYVNSAFGRRYKSAYSYYDDFNDANLFEQNYGTNSANAGTYGITNSTLQGLSCLVGGFILTTKEFENYRIIGKFKATSGASGVHMNIFSHVDSPNWPSVYLFGYYPDGSNQIRLYQNDGRKRFN